METVFFNLVGEFSYLFAFIRSILNVGGKFSKLAISRANFGKICEVGKNCYTFVIL